MVVPCMGAILQAKIQQHMLPCSIAKLIFGVVYFAFCYQKVQLHLNHLILDPILSERQYIHIHLVRICIKTNRINVDRFPGRGSGWRGVVKSYRNEDEVISNLYVLGIQPDPWGRLYPLNPTEAHGVP